jgi:hypothetical protein
VPRQPRSDKQWEPVPRNENRDRRYVSIRTGQPVGKGLVSVKGFGDRGSCLDVGPGPGGGGWGQKLGAEIPRTIDTTPGTHRLMYQDTLVFYRVPNYQPGPPPAGRTYGVTKPLRLVVGIHGHGMEQVSGARDIIEDPARGWEATADRENLVVVAPAFDRIYYKQPPNVPVPVPLPPDPPFVFPADTVEGAAEIHGYYLDHGLPFPAGYIQPDVNLWDFIFLINSRNDLRSDECLLGIIPMFRAAFDFSATDGLVSLFGYSAGGQFVSRFMMLYPGELGRAALGGAGSFMFPSFEFNYPHGFSCHYENDDCVTIWGHTYDSSVYRPCWGLNKLFNRGQRLGWAPFLTEIAPHQWREKLLCLLEKPIWVFAGSDDYLGLEETSDGRGRFDPHLENAWQGNGQMERALNFVGEMYQMDRQLKNAGLRPHDAPTDLYFAGLCGPTMNHGAAGSAMTGWLQANWFRLRRKLPYDPIGGVVPHPGGVVRRPT